MKTINNILLLVVLLILISCKTELKPDLQFVYSIDKQGVFINSLKENTNKQIYSSNKVFLNSYFSFIDDSIIQVGHQSRLKSEEKERKVYSKYFHKVDGDSTFITNNPPYTTTDRYDFLTDSILYINIRKGSSYLKRTLDYEHYEHSELKIKTTEFNEKGKVISQKDTSFACGGTSSSSKGIRFCDFKRYYEKSETILGKTIISKRGDLILQDKNSESVLLKFDGHFDPKFGSGFYNPTLSSDGKKVSFQYLAGFLNSGSCIYEMDMVTQTKTKLIGEGFFNPIYSPDNKFLLLFSDSRKAKNNTWIKDIYILDIETKTKTKVGEGENYMWIPNK
ncbi:MULTISPECIES: hypothetical protein [Winogradskyella]|uniref:hypothetical protein n=1 Tax=Winogradskyella TaxID=286104 RepID=UPI0015CE9BF3|nr:MULTISPECIES: hypothetical protein [Winogradskyella]QXP78775.1 hypothetical protein H0I32_16460 [Winogradskyella sp. HaHa_3_26]